jgi:hypothetical protein
VTQHSDDDACCVCADSEFLEAVDGGQYPNVTAHWRWDYEFCPFAEEDDDHFG